MLATQAGAPGFVVIVEESSLTVRRSHDLTEAARLDDAGGAVSCAALHEPRCGVASSLEVLLGFESGMVGTWVADLSGALLA